MPKFEDDDDEGAKFSDKPRSSGKKGDAGKFSEKPSSRGKKAADGDDEEVDDEDSPKKKRAAGDKAKGGMGIGMILLIVGGLLTCCVCLPGAVGVGFFFTGMSKIGAANERVDTINNAKQLGLALHAYHDVNRSLPSQRMAAGDLSWRVETLPFIEQGNLFNRIDKTKAWNQPPNQMLLSQRPITFESKLHPHGPQDTPFQYFTGQNTLFPDPLRKPKFTDMKDGTSNTAVFAEASAAVPWTRPSDMVVAPAGPIPVPQDMFVVCLADGTCRVMNRKNITDPVLRDLINPADGKILPPGVLD